MYRKTLIIIILASGFALLLFFKPWKKDPQLLPRMEDRLPVADLIGQSDLLELSKSLSKTMFYFKLPFRDYLSADFLLRQGKQYGVDIQKPVFFFANEKKEGVEDWGTLFSIRDSSKIMGGINRLKKIILIKDTTIYNTRVYVSPNHNIYASYGSDWMLIYNGKHFKKILGEVIFAKRNEVKPKWRSFFNQENLDRAPIVAHLHSRLLNDYGIEYASLSLSNDSSSFILNAGITQFDSLSFQLKPMGAILEKQEFSRNLINLHFDIERLRKTPKDPMYKIIKSFGSKVSFPIDDLLKAWEGDIAFRQGGFHTIKEKYIEFVLDDNFNVTEVEKYHDVKVSGFSLYMSVNENRESFLRKLFNKGITRKNEGKYRILYSPPVNLHKTDSSIVFHTGKYIPELIQDSTNSILWTVNYTPVQFYIDSTDVKTVFGRIRIPLKKIVGDHFPDR
jgi:hypothetical protein